MKIGTDGVLLGAWTPIDSSPKTILDVGSGTGLIALMLAQRVPESNLIAIEIEKTAADEATDNFANSPWSNRLQLIHKDFIVYSEQTEDTFDLIISNPPFFKTSFKLPGTSRSAARDNYHLRYEDLFSCVNKLLNLHGSFVMVCPFEYRDDIMTLGNQNHLFLTKELLVRGTKSSSFKRILMQFRRSKSSLSTDELILDESRNKRTAKYQKLVTDFYL